MNKKFQGIAEFVAQNDDESLMNLGALRTQQVPNELNANNQDYDGFLLE